MNPKPSDITVICPKHGEHPYAIESTILGHEGVWCQLCWIESMGPSLPYRRMTDDFQTMEEMIPVPEAGWMAMPKE